MKNYLMFALLIGATASMAFGQIGVVTDAGKVTVDCPDDECHVAPYFKGEGGFIGEVAAGVDEVAIVVDCGIVTTTATATPNGGTVAMQLSMDNGLACPSGGRVEIHGLMDGGWYWINDSANSAVASLVAKDALGNATVAPANPGGTDITLDTPKDGMTSIVKQASTGRIGILHHILPEPEADPADMCGPYYWAPHGRYYQTDSDCMLGDGSTKIVLTADTTDSLGRVQRVSGSVYRRVGSAANNEVRVGFSLFGADGQAHITTDTMTSGSTIKGHDISVPGRHAPPEPFAGNYVVWLIEGSGNNLDISHADIRVDPARMVTEEVPGEETTKMVKKMRPKAPAGEDDTSTRRLEMGYYMGDMAVAQCMQKHDDHADDASRNAVNVFKGADGGEVLVLEGDYPDGSLNLASGSLPDQQIWVRAWHRAGQRRINIVQVVDDEADPAVTYDIPEVVCEMEEYEEEETVTGDPTTKTIISNAGIIIGPAATTHCRSGRADVARLFIGVPRDDVRERNPEIIPVASTGAEIAGTKYAAATVLNVMCPSSSANEAHHASLGGADLVPGTE